MIINVDWILVYIKFHEQFKFIYFFGYLKNEIQQKNNILISLISKMSYKKWKKEEKSYLFDTVLYLLEYHVILFDYYHCLFIDMRRRHHLFVLPLSARRENFSFKTAFPFEICSSMKAKLISLWIYVWMSGWFDWWRVVPLKENLICQNIMTRHQTLNAVLIIRFNKILIWLTNI